MASSDRETRQPRYRRLRTGVVCLAFVATGACRPGAETSTAASLGVTEYELTLPTCEAQERAALRVDTIATGLEVPWGVAFLPGGRALMTERVGRVRMFTPSAELEHEPWAELDVYAPPGSEVGLMGIAVSADVAPPFEVYVAATVQNLGSNVITRILRGVGRRVARAIDPERGQARSFQVVRLLDRGNRGVEPTLIVSGLPGGYLHGGGALEFGPTGCYMPPTGIQRSPHGPSG